MQIALYLLIFGLVFYICNRLAFVWNSSELIGIEKLTGLLDSLFLDIKNHPFWLSIESSDLLAGLLLSTIACMLIFAYTQNRKKYLKGKEHGSAQWGKPKDIKPFMDKNPRNNTILAKSIGLTMKSRLPGREQYERNKNTLVIGGAGSGKTRFYCIPNIMQMHSSYVITDSKGSILKETGKMLLDNGYKIKILDLIDLENSMHYNPFAYIRNEEDVLKLINNIIVNTTDKNKTGGDQFWTDAERLLYSAVMMYVYYEAPPEERNMVTVLQMLDIASASEDDNTSPLDILFDELEQQDPSHIAVAFYRDFKKAAGKTAMSILISVAARLSAFKIKRVRDLLSSDDIQFDTLGEEKTALFILLPDTHTTFNFLAAIFYTQIFDTLCFKADRQYGGRLPVHVRCIIDEFANIGLIPDFEKIIATIRSREISASIIVQTLSQLKALYKEHAETIVGNCDSYLYLGGMDESVRKEVSAMLGKQTIDVRAMNRTFGRSGSTSQSNTIIGRELMTPDELGVMPNSKCIVLIRGCRPFFSRKYILKRHPNYKYLDAPFEITKNVRDTFFDDINVLKLYQLQEI